MLWLKQLFSRRRRYDELSESIREHLDEKVADLTDRGMTRGEAERKARREFGNVTLIEERSREVWRWEFIESVWADLKFAVRQLRKSPGFSLTIILTLALGIGANTAIFSLVNAFLLRPLPYPHADRLVMVWEQLRALGINRFPSPIADFMDYKNDNRVFEGMAGVEDAHYVLTAGDFPQRLFALRVTSNLFQMMGLHPALGRTFSDVDNQPGHERVAILSDSLWRNRFGSDPSIIGRNVILDGQIYEVVGVLQRNVQFSVGYPQTPDVWVPLPLVADPNRSVGNLAIVARLRDGVTLSQAQADMDTVARQLERQYHIQIGPHGEDPGYGVDVIPLREEVAGNLREPLLLMLGAAGLIFLIACANVANLMLTQGVNREREFAIRIALGARRTQLVRLLIVQSAVLALLGEIAGIAVGAVALGALLRLSPYGMAKLFQPSIDMHVIGFASGAAMAALLLSGLLPAMKVLRGKRSLQLTGNAHQVLGGQRGNRVRQTLVVIETALSVAVVIGAGLLIHSFLQIRHVSLGFTPNGLLTAQISLPPGYSTSAQQRTFYEALLQRIKSSPNVDAVAATTLLPIADPTLHNPFSIQGRPWQPYGADRIPQFLNRQAVSTGYFRDLQIALKQGRFFDDRDRVDSQPVVIVNETMVRGFWPGENPIGKHMMQGAPMPGDPWLTVVGVVGDVRSGGAKADFVPEIYTPLAQTPNASMALVLRAKRGNPTEVINSVRTAVMTLDHGIPLTNVATYDEILATQLGPRRYEMLLLAAFGGLALLLAAIGLYGVVSYAVTQRTQEMALRIAFGATKNTVVALVLRQALLLTGCGLFAGVLMALSLRRVLAATLFQVRYLDLPVYVGVSITLLIVALAAAYFPARRAASTDPIQALRTE
jgi:predicted permease